MVRILNQRILIVMCIALLILNGCGKKDKNQQSQSSGSPSTESVASDTNQKESSSVTMAEQEKNMADGEAKNRQALMEMNDGKEIEPVETGTLKGLLPTELAGMKRTEASVERNQMMGVDMAVAQGQYEAEDGNSSIRIMIMDAGNLSGPMKMGMAGWTMRQYNRETDTGYEKTISYKGYKGMEEYDNTTKDSELRVFVADRFIVEVDGSRTGMDAVKKAVDTIDFKKMASLASGS